jgi:hypothetical protein
MILPATAKFTGGVCMPCHHKIASPPPPPMPERDRSLRRRAYPDGPNIEEAVSRFLEIGRNIKESNPITGRVVLERVLRWYREVRIAGTDFDEDDDMLLLQWGSLNPLLLSEPTDMRHRAGEKWQFSQEPHRYIDFTRQVCPASDNDDEEFDDVAVQMSITLAFEPADGSEPSGNTWISTPDAIDDGTKALMNRYVTALIDKPASIIAISASNIG